jgi:hypothetical protein
VQVIELSKGSKPLAINTGLERATGRSVFVVDADVLVDAASLRAAAAPLLSGEVFASAPRLRVDTSRSSSAVVRYYAVWEQLPYVTQGMIGSGVYGLSRDGLARVGKIPAIIGDDAYVRTLFSPAERRTVEQTADGTSAVFSVYPPTSLRDLVRIEVRRRAADQEMTEIFGRSGAAPGRQLAFAFRGVLTGKVGPLAAATFIYVKVACRVLYVISRARGTNKAWRRDESSRVAKGTSA